MAWSKAGTTTKAWTYGSGQGGNNAYNVDGDAILQEYIEFLKTRGWSCTYSMFGGSDGAKTHKWLVVKNAITEDGGTCVWSFVIEYYNAGLGQGDDTLKILAWDSNSGQEGQRLEDFYVTSSYSQCIGGQWTFWQSDQDSDSYAIITNSAARSCVGFWPPSGSMFFQGDDANYGNRSGLKPFFHDDPSWEAEAGAANVNLLNPMVGDASSISRYMNPGQVRTGFVWACNGYERPLFYMNNTDVSYLLDFTANNQQLLAATPNNRPVTTTQLDGNYYLLVGYGQLLMLNTGTVAPSI